MRLNHYGVRSREDFAVKASRSPKCTEEFWRHHDRNEVFDDSARVRLWPRVRDVLRGRERSRGRDVASLPRSSPLQVRTGGSSAGERQHLRADCLAVGQARKSARCRWSAAEAGITLRIMTVIQTDPGILGGKPCFAGTRVPIKNLFDYLSHNRAFYEFLRDFPTVSADQVRTLLGLAQERLSHTSVPAHVG